LSLFFVEQNKPPYARFKSAKMADEGYEACSGLSWITVKGLNPNFRIFIGWSENCHEGFGNVTKDFGKTSHHNRAPLTQSIKVGQLD
jgi:hypothetical protein